MKLSVPCSVIPAACIYTSDSIAGPTRAPTAMKAVGYSVPNTACHWVLCKQCNWSNYHGPVPHFTSSSRHINKWLGSQRLHCGWIRSTSPVSSRPYRAMPTSGIWPMSGRCLGLVLQRHWFTWSDPPLTCSVADRLPSSSSIASGVQQAALECLQHPLEHSTSLRDTTLLGISISVMASRMDNTPHSKDYPDSAPNDNFGII